MSIRKMFFISLCLVLGACSSDLFLVHNGNMPSQERINQIQVGQSKEDVAYILGSPPSKYPIKPTTSGRSKKNAIFLNLSFFNSNHQ